jgi:hypothetical protein
MSDAAIVARVLREHAKKQFADPETDDMTVSLAADLAEAQAQIAAARSALEFYKDGFKYHPRRSKTGINLSECKPTDALLEDCGERALQALSTLAQEPAGQSEVKENALKLLAAEDERQSKLHDILEVIREQIRLEVAPEHRPDGLFQNIQNAVYAMRGRTPLMNDAAITAALAAHRAVPAGSASPGVTGDVVARSALEPFDPHPHWRVEHKNESYPKTVEQWDPHKDPVGQHLALAVRRLRMAMDRDDPRAPDEMALISRWDLTTLVHDWWHKCAVFDLWRGLRTKTDEEAEPIKHDRRVMFMCECCEENDPETSVSHREDVAVMPDGTWLCSSCYEDCEKPYYGFISEDGDDFEYPRFEDLPRPPATPILPRGRATPAQPEREAGRG